MALWPGSERPPTLIGVDYRIYGAFGGANLDLFRDTFERPEDAERCVDCAEALLDAAGR